MESTFSGVLIKKVQIGNDQEMAQSERNSHSINRGVKRLLMRVHYPKLHNMTPIILRFNTTIIPIMTLYLIYDFHRPINSVVFILASFDFSNEGCGYKKSDIFR